MAEIVVAEDVLFAPAVADALDHRGMVEFVGKDDQARQKFRQRRQRGVVRGEAGIEGQRHLLAVKVGKFLFEFDVVMGCTGNIAGAAGTGANLIQRLVHGGQDLRVLSHSEIIVAAPDGHRPFDAVGIMIGERIFAAFAHQIGEYAITAFLLQAGKTFLKPYAVRVCHEFVSSVLKKRFALNSLQGNPV